MKYQKKPEFVEAIQWTTGLRIFKKIKDLCQSSCCVVEYRGDDYLTLTHPDGDVIYVYPGDYIIKNSFGCQAGSLPVRHLKYPPSCEPERLPPQHEVRPV